MTLGDVDGVLARAANVDGRRRFYPAGAHPSTHGWREHIFFLEGLERDGHLNADGAEALATARKQVEMFERMEDVEKARYLLAHYDRQMLGEP